jgi:hypothetical protein
LILSKIFGSLPAALDQGREDKKKHLMCTFAGPAAKYSTSFLITYTVFFLSVFNSFTCWEGVHVEDIIMRFQL